MSIFYAATKIDHELSNVPLNDPRTSGSFELLEFTAFKCEYVLNVAAQKVVRTYDYEENGIISPMYALYIEMLENGVPYLSYISYTDDLTFEGLLKKLTELADLFGPHYVRPTTDGSTIQNIIRRSSDTCSECIYCTAANSDHFHDNDWMCHHENSTNFGKMLNHPGSTKHWACADYKAHSYDNMSFEDALEHVVIPDGIISSYQHHFEPDSEEYDRAYIVYSFKTNTDLQKWSDAMSRLFKEYILIAAKKDEMKGD